MGKKAILEIRHMGNHWAICSGRLVVKRFDTEQQAYDASNDPVKRRFWEYWAKTVL